MKRILLSLLTLATSLYTAKSAEQPRQLPQWLEKAVIYQVYPASFQDSDGNGIGDLKGIESRLDYIKSIGVNTIWLSPIFDSEFFDGGYDITDFYKVDPRYGTNTQLVELVEKVHEKGMRIFMDLVAGHTSDQHPWFKQSQEADRNLQHSDYYIWTDSKDVKPKNFVTPIGGEREGNYLKNFFDCQPALNYGYANPDPNHPWEQPVDAPGPQAVRQELKNIISFWMDKGMDGFRVDMAHSLIKNDKNHVETIKLWREVQDWFAGKYPEGAFVSEWGEPTKSIKGGHFHIDFIFHIGRQGYTSLFYNTDKKQTDRICYFEKEGRGQVKKFIDMYRTEYANNRGLGYLSIPTSNHDIWRLRNDRRDDYDQLKTAMTFLLTMPGIPTIYYGDEIGMRYIFGLPNVEGSVLKSRNRAGCRTPMQWNQDLNKGFSTADPSKLYIAQDPAADAPTVINQDKDPESLLNYVRALLRLRSSSDALGNSGEWEFISDTDQPYPMVYTRTAGKERYVIAINPSAKKVSAEFTSLKANGAEVVISANDKVTYKCAKGRNTMDKVTLAPVSAAVIRLK